MGAATTTRRSLGLLTLAVVAVLTLAGSAQAQAPVPLGTAGNFGVLAGTTVTNTGPTVVTGDLGVSPGGAVVGFPPGVVNGTIHAADAIAAQAQLDLTTAYNNAAGQPVTQIVATELGGTTLGPGVYASAAGDFQITGTLTLDGQGNPNAIFIFKTASTLVTAAGSQVNLINGAQSCNVFWQVGSSATLGTNSVFRGNILALTAITATTGAAVDGRLLARNAAVTLDTNTVTAAQCVVSPPPPGTGLPTIAITKVPKRCTTTDFTVRIKVADPGGIRSTDVFLDGKRIKRSTSKSFTVRINASELSPGRHAIKVVTRDLAGNKRVKKVGFSLCDRPAISFTG